MEGCSRFPVPNHSALPLVGDAHSGQVGGVEAGGVQSGLDAHLHVALLKKASKWKQRGRDREKEVRAQGSEPRATRKTPPVARLSGMKAIYVRAWR